MGFPLAFCFVRLSLRECGRSHGLRLSPERNCYVFSINTVSSL